MQKFNCTPTRCLLPAMLLPLFLSSIQTAWGLPITSHDSSGRPALANQEEALDPSELLTKITTEFRRGNLSAVGQYAARLKKAKPDDSDAAALCSISFLAQGDVAKAKEELQRAKKLKNDSFYISVAESMQFLKEKEYQTAEKTIDKAIKIDDKHPYPWNIKGRIQSEQGKHQQALAYYEKALEREQGFYPALLNLGATHFLLNDLDASIGYFSSAIRLDQENHNAHLGIGLAYEASNRSNLAIKHFYKALELNPSNTSLLQNIAKNQLKIGLYNDAKKTATKLKETNNELANLILADISLHTGNPKEALEMLSTSDEANPDSLYLKSRCYLAMKDFANALGFSEKTILASPNHFGAHISRIVLKIYLDGDVASEVIQEKNWPQDQVKLIHLIKGALSAEKGDNSQALTSLTKAAEVVGGFSTSGLGKNDLANSNREGFARHFCLGVLYYYNKFSKEALEAFDAALKVAPDSILSHYWIAQAYLEGNLRDNAITSLEKATEKSPNFFAALYSLAELYFLSGNDTEAIKYYNRAIAVQKNPGILLKLGLLHEKTNNFKSAEMSYEELIKNNPDLYVGYNQLAWLYAKRAVELDKAMNLAQKADKLQPGNKGITDTIGWIFFHKKNYDKALSYITKAHKIDPSDQTILYHLGAVNLAMGDARTARQYLEKALSASQDFEEADEVRKLLSQIN